MAITAKFQADFSNFTEGVQQAEVKLASMKVGTDNVGVSLTKMVENFSGARIVRDATLMAEVFDRAGGSAKFTEAELSRMGAAGQEAAAKLKALGQEVPAGIQRIADTARTAAPQINTMQQSLSQFDSVLSALGIHVEPEIRAIGEIGSASGKSASELGTLATAGLALGAGIGGWKIGRLVADFFDLDDKIAKATAALLGFGDVGGQTAGAKQDVINKAIANGASAMVTYTEAIAFNKTHQIEFLTQTERSAAAVAVWRTEIEKVKAKGDLAQLTADLASHNFELKTLSARYGISVEALQFMNRETAAANAASKERLAHLKAEETAIRAWNDVLAELNTAGVNFKKTLEGIDGETVSAVKFYLQAGVAQGTLAKAYELTAVQVKAVASALAAETAELGRAAQARTLHMNLVNRAILDEFNATVKLNEAYGQNVDGSRKVTSALDQLNAALDALHARKVEGVSQYYQEQLLMKAYTDGLYEEAKALDVATAAASKHNAEMKSGQDISFNSFALDPKNGDLAEQARARGGTLAYDSNGNPYVYIPGRSAPPPSRRSGGNFSASAVQPNLGASGANVVINITSPLGTPSQIAKAVGGAFDASLRGSGMRMPAGS